MCDPHCHRSIFRDLFILDNFILLRRWPTSEILKERLPCGNKNTADPLRNSEPLNTFLLSCIFKMSQNFESNANLRF